MLKFPADPWVITYPATNYRSQLSTLGQDGLYLFDTFFKLLRQNSTEGMPTPRMFRWSFMFLTTPAKTPCYGIISSPSQRVFFGIVLVP
jgi:hypothetical protein